MLENITAVLNVVPLAQPPFETGYKGLGNALLRRYYRSEQGEQALSRYKVRGNARVSSSTANLREQFVQLGREGLTNRSAYDLLSANLLFFPDHLHLRASPFHLDHWTRDSFISSLSINDPFIERALLGRVTSESRQGQVPTVRLIGSKRFWWFDDESTMLAMIWRAKLQNMGWYISPAEREQWQDRLGWIEGHVEDGKYHSPPGAMRSWLDTFNFRKRSVIGYNQGIYVAALMGATQLGLKVDPQVRAQAEAGYGSYSTDPERLTLSNELPYQDVSALFGEFITNHLFNHSVLSDQLVQGTIDSFKIRRQNWPVLFNGEDYLSADHFHNETDNAPGYYHNGGAWLAFSAAATRVAERRGITVPVSPRKLAQIALDTQNAEYLITLSGAPRPFDVARKENTWNTLVHTLTNR